MRMFAGPNGSGKTTLFHLLAKEHSSNGLFKGEPFVNADGLESELRTEGRLALARYGIAATQDELAASLCATAWNDETHRTSADARLENGVITLPDAVSSSYAAAQLAAFIRSRLLAATRSFSFETVMSHPGKITLLREARARGFRTYLYFVSTDNVELNVGRVGVRVQVGGHAVPEEKIRERYRRSLALLPEAVKECDRAYLFDNSTESHVLLAEIAAGKIAAIHEDDERMPAWFTRFREQPGR